MLKTVVFFSLVFLFFGCAKDEIQTPQHKTQIVADDTEKQEMIADEFYKRLKLKKPKKIEDVKLHDFGYMYFNKEEQ